MEDYEYYHVDQPEKYIPEEFTLKVIHAEEDIAKFFRPTHEATIPGLLFPLEAFILGDAVLTRCKTIEEAKATLLKH